MEQKGIWLLSVILILGFSALTEGEEAPAQCLCNMDPKSRVNCGPPGITAEQCLNKGCCFSSEVAGVPWCFAPLARQYQKVCPTAVKLRKNCGPPGITADQCQAKGCCFESYPPAVPWCFHPIEVEEGSELQTAMEQKGIWLLSVILILGFSALTEGEEAPAQCRCNTDPKSRVNCGPPGITAEQCWNKGCCFSSEVAGVPWCFAPLARQYQKVCPTAIKLRKNCGPPGITADQCQAKGCCFESNPPAVPWCFHPIEVEEAEQLTFDVFIYLHNITVRAFVELLVELEHLLHPDILRRHFPPRDWERCCRCQRVEQDCVEWDRMERDRLRGAKTAGAEAASAEAEYQIPTGLQTTMEHKGFWLLALVLILGLSSPANGYTELFPEQCALQPNARVNCGYPYISAQECSNRGCCFDDSIDGVIWCFFPKTEED
ncbi:integumentary mucin C.1-like [Emydura macquarii macquarii]|uniref:integumentary mucin C.1-like n=1 Tax=Emydura macquarii macquarii TaxID=1129001 RepID=UPI00352AD5E0